MILLFFLSLAPDLSTYSKYRYSSVGGFFPFLISTRQSGKKVSSVFDHIANMKAMNASVMIYSGHKHAVPEIGCRFFFSSCAEYGKEKVRN